MSHAGREFDAAAEAYAAASKYPWGRGDNGVNWVLTTEDADPAPEFETLCLVALDPDTGKVLLATYKFLPPLTDTVPPTAQFEVSLTSHESADAAMAAAEPAYDRGLA